MVVEKWERKTRWKEGRNWGKKIRTSFELLDYRLRTGA